MPDDVPDAPTARRLLDAERTRLTTLLDEAEQGAEVTEERPSDDVTNEELHPGDTGTDLQDRGQDEAVITSIRSQLGEVEAAFARADAGTYGRCEVCGRPIGTERLEAVPAARFCVEDERSAEGGAMGGIGQPG